ncbi:hypothetical protein LEN26_004526 [Aphanomyces euteiches]|nr:hypothetical protein LEN26_009995 [Aphanomyces euteiches]KAH9124072.1 hypothetical protein AeMF1_005105 [Aphanomyces euteiches]KAH9147269.1 hypothetical protein LEN26_004756 [Aphanomyces euteiches]KAH9148343.1 hypothetical protein LEN26_004523 [Aphanomyces euteiches]KAH9148346.1 hypothetical protein LEN26_004526 [Aphanomyces euteiches]
MTWSSFLVGLLIVSAGVHNTAAQSSSSPCADSSFASQPTVSVGPFEVRSLVKGSSVCIQASAQSTSMSWMALSISRSSSMVNSPTNNAIVFDTVNNAVHSYVLGAYSTSGVTRQTGAATFTTQAMSSANGVLSFTIERALASSSSFDVAIDPSVATNLLWAHGSSAWPSVHSDRGSVKLQFASSSSGSAPQVAAADGIARVETYTAVIGAIAFGIIVLLGLVASYVIRWRFIHLSTLFPPSRRLHALSWFTNPWSDIKMGEVVVVLVYIGAMAAVGVSINDRFPSATSDRLASLVSGHLALLSVMFLLLPVAKGEHWEQIFGSSHERIVKLHRWLGRIFVIAAIVHLVFSAKSADVTSSKKYGSQQVVPLYGFIAFIAFASMSVAAVDPIRRKFYEVFYYYHRVASIVGVVFVLLHSKAVQYAMIFPLAIYGLAWLIRFPTFLNRFEATTEVHCSKTVLITLPSTPRTEKWVKNSNPCVFFWVNIPSVSRLEWHPFSGIVTPDGKSIAFCMKGLTPGGFVDRVVSQASQQVKGSLTIYVDGPHGKPTLDVNAYDSLVLLGGGIGVTPMLSLINRFRQSQGGPTLHFFWVVRTPEELLAAESIMFPLPANVKASFYVSEAAEDGRVQVNSDEYVAYIRGRPKLDEVISTTRCYGDKVGVLACGPPPMVQEAQWLAHSCHFDFHKEVFLL